MACHTAELNKISLLFTLVFNNCGIHTDGHVFQISWQNADFRLTPRCGWNLHSFGTLNSVGCLLPTFQDNVFVQYSGADSPEISVTNYHLHRATSQKNEEPVLAQRLRTFQEVLLHLHSLSCCIGRTICGSINAEAPLTLPFCCCCGVVTSSVFCCCSGSCTSPASGDNPTR